MTVTVLLALATKGVVKAVKDKAVKGKVVKGKAVLVGHKVRSDSTIKIPMVGKVKVVGLTLNEIETKFENLKTK